jgi:peptidoglycan L-alanyl-D-glutamate endopeptidase CwlK
LFNIRRHQPVVVDAMVNAGLQDRAMLLMAFCTVRAETAGFAPIDEGLSRYNSSPRGHPFDLYDNRRDLGNRGRPDGERFRGRGFIQLTGRHNYTVYAERLRQPLVDHPDLANDPEVAAALLALFLKDHERAIKNALVQGDLRSARRCVNGGSHGLASFTQAWRVGERLTADD